MPFDGSSGQIIVRADLGRGEARRLILDTGAYESYLWSEEAAALGLTPSEPLRRRDASTSFTVRHVHGVRVAVGKAVVDGQSFATKPRPMRHADGFLGYPWLSHFVVEVDFTAHRLRFWTPACDRGGPDATPVPLRFVEGRMPTLAATLTLAKGAPIDAELMVDTGAGTTAILNTPFVAEHELLARAGRLANAETGGVGGGRSALAVARAASLRVGDFTLERPIIELGKPDTAAGAGSFGADHPWDGILGCGVLSRFDVVIDYPHARLLLRPTARFGEPFPHDVVQALLEETPAGLRVVALRHGGGADRAGLRPDDLIVAIAGAPAGTLTRKAFWAVADREGVHVLDVRRGGERVQLKLVIENVL
ncbi:MAG TPA: aspartyl protease family protein [Thermoanaerobaculia bacterium]|nr:aspartyl protease family protein [Thermoanaerobaculia bacterium]